MNLGNDDAKDIITADIRNDPKKMQDFERSLLKCISDTVDSGIRALDPLKKRVKEHIAHIKK